MSLYQFKKQDAFDFASFVGIRTKTYGDELNFTRCPYCKGGNKGKDKDTFSINLKTGQFKCLRASCGVSGNMVTLARDFDFSLGSEVDNYYRPKQHRTLKTPEKPIVPKPKAIEYLESRKISKKTAEKYEVTVRKDHDNILVFPFFDEKNNLQFVKYRKTDFDKAKDRNKEWCEKDCKPILFGMKQCKTGGTLIITEGQLDTLAVAEAGYENCASVPLGKQGFTWIPYCWDWINRNFDTIIVFGDYENGSISLLDDINRRFNLTIKHVRETDYKDCKDANDILRKYGVEQIKTCIENAVAVPIRDVVDLADVEDVDIFKIPKLKTGIKELDRMLYGGLPFGGVHLISGKAGEGKSTLASQIVINAREQGYKCFCYSGELPSYLFKAWMSFQVAGSHVFEYQNEWGDRNFNISDANKKIISSWYKDYIWLYDANNLDEDEHAGLIKTTEQMIKQYGCRVILLDNLMTAIDLETVAGDDKYERQSKFVKQLAQLARAMDVCILLVAHKRKNNFSTNANDEIAGSSDIANLAMVTLAYEKGDNLMPSERKLKLAKNRLFGKTNNEGWIVSYEESSKRIYGDGDNPMTDYTCFKEVAQKEAWGDINFETPFDAE